MQPRVMTNGGGILAYAGRTAGSEPTRRRPGELTGQGPPNPRDRPEGSSLGNQAMTLVMVPSAAATPESLRTIATRPVRTSSVIP